MKHIKTFEKLITTREEQNEFDVINRYRFKIGEYVKVINIPENIYKIVTINTEDPHQPYQIVNVKSTSSKYGVAANIITHLTPEELDEFMLQLDANKYNL